MSRVLVTVARFIDSDAVERVEAGLRPVLDFTVMARYFPADTLTYAQAQESTGWFGRLLGRIGGPNLMLAWAAFERRRQYDVIFTDGEHIGLPFALFCKLARWHGTYHLMIVHIISVFKKMVFFDVFRVHSHIDTFFVYSTWQKRFIEQRWNIPSEQVVFTPFMVDTEFYNSARVQPEHKRLICAAGLEFRDYPTLIKAVEGLDVQVVIAAASPYSKRPDTTVGVELPPNVTIHRLNYVELRQLYADSLFMVMPLYDVPFQAGVTAMLEAMAMERPIICSRTRGQTDVIVEGETGLYVPPGDPQALRMAIQRLLDDPELTKRMGKAARHAVEHANTLEAYVERLASYIQAGSPVRSGQPLETANSEAPHLIK